MKLKFEVMESVYIDNVRDNLNDLAIAANESNIKRAEFGFVNSDCDYIKSMLSALCLQAIDNKDIFNDEQFTNIKNLINKLNYG